MLNEKCIILILIIYQTYLNLSMADAGFTVLKNLTRAPIVSCTLFSNKNTVTAWKYKCVEATS